MQFKPDYKDFKTAADRKRPRKDTDDGWQAWALMGAVIITFIVLWNI